MGSGKILVTQDLENAGGHSIRSFGPKGMSAAMFGGLTPAHGPTPDLSIFNAGVKLLY